MTENNRPQDRAQGGDYWEMAVHLVLGREYLLILSRVTASHLWLPSHFASGCVITSSRMVSRRLPQAALGKCWATCNRPACPMRSAPAWVRMSRPNASANA